MGFEVHTFPTYSQAECEAIEMPDINWDRLVEFHKDSYLFLRDHIKKALDVLSVAVDFKHYLCSPEQTKNRMFERILHGQELLTETHNTTGFRLVYNMNDIISFVIVNPWVQNLHDIADRLIRTDRLRIFNKMEKDGIIQLIGRTDIGTTYEILLITSIVHNWMLWKDKNPKLPIDTINAHLKNTIRTQKIIDATPLIK
jgi:hypothetical protein